MAQYLLLLHEPVDGFGSYSPQEMQQVIQRYVEWGGRLAESGKLKDSHKLKDDGGRRVLRRDGSPVLDGPFSETKEVIGGYYLLEADSYDEVFEMASDCPHLDFGEIEVREIEVAG